VPKWPRPNHQPIAKAAVTPRLPSISHTRPVKATTMNGMRWTGGSAAVAATPSSAASA
jgi:hypothetical protein